MNGDRLTKIVLFGLLPGVKQKVDCPRIGSDGVMKRDLKETRTSWEKVKIEISSRLR